MAFGACVWPVRTLRRSAVDGAAGKALRRAEMRELKCGLNLPSVIGQTLSFLVANPRPSGIGPRSRRPNTPLPRRYSSKPGIAVFIGRHIFNRSFRNDVNARAIPCCGLISYLLHRADVGAMSALGQKRTLRLISPMSALPPKADID
jgi:hypothetical protein